MQELKSEDYEDYEPDVQESLLQQEKDASFVMHRGEKYINAEGQHFTVLKDAPAGEVYVYAQEKLSNGYAYRLLPKTLLREK